MALDIFCLHKCVISKPTSKTNEHQIFNELMYMASFTSFLNTRVVCPIHETNLARIKLATMASTFYESKYLI